MILEELLQTDTVLLDNLFDFLHQLVVCSDAIEVSESVSESRLSTSGGSIDDILETVGSAEEFVVLDGIFFVTIDESDSVDLLLIDLETKSVQNLTEDLGGNLE